MKYYSFNAVWLKYICLSKCCAVPSHIWLSAIPWTVTHQAPLSMGILQARSGLPCPPPGDLPRPGVRPRSSTLQRDSSLSEPPGKPENTGVGRQSLLQRSFLVQESNWGPLHYRWFFISWATGEAHVLANLYINVGVHEGWCELQRSSVVKYVWTTLECKKLWPGVKLKHKNQKTLVYTRVRLIFYTWLFPL